MSLVDEEPEEIVVPAVEDRAVVIGAPSATERSRWGRRIDDLASGEWAALLRTLDPATRALIESQRLTAGLVELDQTARKMLKTAKVITEEGGWIQATLRNDRGRVTRLMRVRPATGIAAMSGGAAVLGAIAAQAQAAEMARDIKAIRQRMDVIAEHQRSDQAGAVENVVKRVEDLVADLRAHGERGVDASAFSVLSNSLGDARHKCSCHLDDAVTRLEKAAQERPRQAEKILSEEAVKEAALYLDSLAKCYTATVRFGFAQIAFEYHRNKPDVARTRAERIIQSAAELRAETEDVHGRLGRLDETLRARFRPAPRTANAPSWVSDVLAATASTAAKQLVGKSVRLGRVRGTPISLPAASAAVAAGALFVGVEGAKAVAQSRAEKKLDERLDRLAEATSRSSEALAEAAPSLDLLRTLTEELAGPGA
ncbi:hypothetical protein GCM10010129_58480 [Streptomyces fumigatiscleroticus]|nr:hypothetical protein GCM10010129_58480 [Streptomyces fumigatiscleroticus]